MNARIERRKIVKKTVSHEEVVILEMSRDEAQALRDVCGHISGSQDSRRRHADAIADRLHRIGVRLDAPVDDMRGGIACSDLTAAK